MQRFIIQGLNSAWLALVFIGLPAATREQWWNLQISSASQPQLLMLWASGLAAAANLIGALGLVKGQQERKVCWEWLAVFAGLLLVQYAYYRGAFNFEWLKQAMRWVQKRF